MNFLFTVQFSRVDNIRKEAGFLATSKLWTATNSNKFRNLLHGDVIFHSVRRKIESSVLRTSMKFTLIEYSWNSRFSYNKCAWHSPFFQRYTTTIFPSSTLCLMSFTKLYTRTYNRFFLSLSLPFFTLLRNSYHRISHFILSRLSNDIKNTMFK